MQFIELRGREMNTQNHTDLYRLFEAYTVKDLEALLLEARDHDEKAFYRALLNLKLQISQEKLIGKVLL